MVPFARLAFITRISLELASTAAGQSSSAIPSIPVSTVRVPRELVRLTDTTSDLVLRSRCRSDDVRAARLTKRRSCGRLSAIGRLEQ
jgi:hypothetical protein